jgi:hypothetical protein
MRFEGDINHECGRTKAWSSCILFMTFKGYRNAHDQLTAAEYPLLYIIAIFAAIARPTRHQKEMSRHMHAIE